jgi:hypothetical protein
MKRRVRTTGYVCLLCERWYAEIEDAEVCEQSHAEEHPREKHDDDGREYGHPDDERQERFR